MAILITDHQAARWERARGRGIWLYVLGWMAVIAVIDAAVVAGLQMTVGRGADAVSKGLGQSLASGAWIGAVMSLGLWIWQELCYARWLRATHDAESTGHLAASATSETQRQLRKPSVKLAVAVLAVLVIAGLAWPLVDQAAHGWIYRLEDRVDDALDAGTPAQVEADARRMLMLAKLFPSYGGFPNAIHHGHVALGLIALDRGDVGAAREHLLDAGRVDGSPSLNTFGPNMLLAKALLERGERGVVLSYFDLCRHFWRTDDGDLDRWAEAVRAGETPDFGANLRY